MTKPDYSNMINGNWIMVGFS